MRLARNLISPCLFSYIDENKQKFIKNLDDAVAIKSVSAWPDVRPEIVRMVKWVATRLEQLGATTELKDIGKQVKKHMCYSTKPYGLNQPFLGTL